MKLIIEIPKRIYNYAIRNITIANSDRIDVAEAIINGKPLPKGHGRFIAEPTEEDIAETIGGKNDFADCIREAVKAVFDNAPTIIEAERNRNDTKNIQ